MYLEIFFLLEVSFRHSMHACKSYYISVMR